MTDQERKMLKSYLTECLEPRLKTATEYEALYAQRMEAATALFSTTSSPKAFVDAESASKSRFYWQGRRDEAQRSIDDFRELFEEDLKEEE